MPKAVLDSSILVSAFIAPQGELSELLREPLLSCYELVLSEEILAETAATLLIKESVRRYATYTDAEVRSYLGWLLGHATLVSELPELAVVADDPDDDMVVATAIAGKADYLVSGDRHLKALGSYQGITILSPRQFLELLESEAKAA